MTYAEAKNYLDENKDKIPSNVSLLIAPQNFKHDEYDLKLKTGESENKSALEELGLIGNDDLEVYTVFEAGGRIYYPTLSYYFQTNAKTNPL